MNYLLLFFGKLRISHPGRLYDMMPLIVKSVEAAGECFTLQREM